MPTKHTLILDSSQIEDFLICPELWRYKNKHRVFPSSYDTRAMDMGTLGHHFEERYFKARARGVTIFDAKNSVIDVNNDAKSLEIITRLNIQREDVQSVIRTVEEYITRSCISEFVPKSSDHVEVGFSEKLYEDDSVLFVLEGKIDLIGTYRNTPTIVDHKFHLRVVQVYPKKIQFRNYAMVCGANSLIVNHLVFANGNKKIPDTNYYLDPISFTSEENASWKQELIGIYCQVLETMEAMEYRHMRNRASCSGLYGKPCQWATLCNEYDADLRDRKQEQLYTIREGWKPW